MNPAETAAPPRTTLDRVIVRRFVSDNIAPRADEYDRTGRVPEDLLTALSQTRMWAPFLPSEWGGLDMDMATLAAVHEEVGRGCSSVRSLLTVHAMVAWAVHRWGSPAQRAKWLARLAAGTALGSLCLTEPTGGSDATRLATMAVRDSSGWRLTGVKEWITGGQRADVFLVFARTERGIAAFLVPRDSPGVKITAIHDVLGTRASMLARVTLRQVAVDADAMVGPDGFAAGMVITGTLDLGRLSVAAGSVGILQACLDACARYTASRTVGTTRLRDLQLIRAKITDMVTDVHAGRQLCERAALLKDAGDPDALMATMIAKYFSSRAAARHASEAVQIHGANGCGPHYPVARYYRDAKIMEIIEGSSEIQQITIADDAYRGPAS